MSAHLVKKTKTIIFTRIEKLPFIFATLHNSNNLLFTFCFCFCFAKAKTLRTLLWKMFLLFFPHLMHSNDFFRVSCARGRFLWFYGRIRWICEKCLANWAFWIDWLWVSIEWVKKGHIANWLKAEMLRFFYQ